MNQEKPSVVVTGMGLAVPTGASVDDAWQRWQRAQPPAQPSKRLDAQAEQPILLAEVPAFDLARDLRAPKNEKFMAPGVRFAVRAAKEAVRMSALDLDRIDPFRLAVYTGSGQTGLESGDFFGNLEVANGGTIEADFANMGGRAARVLDRYFSLRTLSNAGLGLLSMEFGAKGPSNNFVQDDTASTWAIASGARDLEDGRCDVAIVGGYDCLLTPSNYLAYKQAGLLSALQAADAHRPFDRHRDGMVLGEGAGFLVLERGEDARRRGAPILAELLGVGHAMETNDVAAAKLSAEVVRAAIDDAARGRPIDLVVAHGIGTQQGDRDEARTLAATLPPDVPVTALKGITGYLGAATAAVELVLALKAAREGILPPIIPAPTPDEDCGLALVTGQGRRLARDVSILALSWSWFGACAAVAVRALPATAER